MILRVVELGKLRQSYHTWKWQLKPRAKDN